MKKIIYLSIIASIAIFSSCGTGQPDQDKGAKIESSSENLNDDTQTGEGIQAGSEKHACTEKCTSGTHKCGSHCKCGDGCQCTPENTCSAACQIKKS